MDAGKLLKILKFAFDFIVQPFKKCDATVLRNLLRNLLACILICILVCITINKYTSDLTIKEMDKHTHHLISDLRDTINNDMIRILDKRDFEKDSIRKVEEERAIGKQSIIKSQLKSYCSELDCEYILTCQLHNNVSSLNGCQFIKFNVTYNVRRKGLPSIDNDDFKDVDITKYDIIPKVWNEKTSIYSMREIMDVDEVLYSQIRRYGPSVETIVFDHITINDNRDGVIIYMFRKGVTPNLITINNCTAEISGLLQDK